jgi:hypothetical protein
LYSPTRPTTKEIPKTNSITSDEWSRNIVTDSARSTRYPVDLYSLIGAIGIALPGFALWFIAITHLWKNVVSKVAVCHNPSTRK